MNLANRKTTILLRGLKIMFVEGTVLDLGILITEKWDYKVKWDNIYKYLKGIDKRD